MNQILYNKKNNKLKYIFKVQLIISIVVIMIIIGNFLFNYNKAKKLEKISEVLDKNIKISSIYKTEKIEIEELYFGKIYIEKIDLKYTVFNKYNDELLKIAPCKFYGGKLGEPGNIAIAGHNYNNENFFSRLDELELKDEIILMDLKENTYKYIIYDKFEANEKDLYVLNQNKNYDLTLLTCNNVNKKRLIIKAFRKDKVLY